MSGGRLGRFADGSRLFEPLSGGCWFCRAIAVWLVTEKETGEQLETCDEHKFTAFS